MANEDLKKFVQDKFEEPEKYSIEAHGTDKDGKPTYALYCGRNEVRHGYNLCRLDDFDMNGESTRELIVKALNKYVEQEPDKAKYVKAGRIQIEPHGPQSPDACESLCWKLGGSTGVGMDCSRCKGKN